jgi:hypothetical protein
MSPNIEEFCKSFEKKKKIKCEKQEEWFITKSSLCLDKQIKYLNKNQCFIKLSIERKERRENDRSYLEKDKLMKITFLKALMCC